MRDCLQKKAINSIAAEMDECEKKKEETMSSLQLLNVVKAKMESPKGEAKELVFMDAQVNGKSSWVLVDTGAIHNFISSKEAKRVGLKVSLERGSIKVINSSAKTIDEVVYGVKLRLGKWSGMVDFSVVPTDDYSIVLGMDFLVKVKVIPMPFFDTMCIAEG